MRRLLIVIAGVAAGVVAAVFVDARAQLRAMSPGHSGMPDIASDDISDNSQEGHDD